MPITWPVDGDGILQKIASDESSTFAFALSDIIENAVIRTFCLAAGGGVSGLDTTSSQGERVTMNSSGRHAREV